MQKLLLLYWGTVFLMYLSQTYYPAAAPLGPRQTGRRHFLLCRADIFMTITILWLTCFSFLRTAYNDTGNYIYGFNRSPTVAEGFADGTFTDWTGNPWSMLYQSVIHDLTGNYHVFFFFPALLSSFAAIKFFKSYSVNPTFSMLVFLSLGTYITYIAALKQSVAIFFLLMAIPYALEKKYVRFYLLLIVAILFHTHAFLFAILPLLMGKPWGKITWVMLAVVLFAMLTYDYTLGAYMRYAQSIGAMVAEIELFDSHSVNPIRLLIYWVPALLGLIFRKRLFSDSSRKENLFANMTIVSAFVLTIGLVQAANLFGRMAAYFEIAVTISLPWMFKKLFTKSSAQFITICAGVLYFGYFLYEFGISKNFGADYQAITLWAFVQELFAH